MTPAETINGNRLIAEFMGYKLVTPNMRKRPDEWTASYWEHRDFKGSSRGVLCSEHGLSYNCSWNWLMKVIDKIESLGYPVKIKENNCWIILPDVEEFGACKETKINATWTAVISFIEWYNKYEQL